MAQKNNRLLIYGAVAVIAIAGFVLTEPEKPTASPVAKTTKKAPTAKKNVNSAYTEEDEAARFARLDEPISNVFKPAVIDAGKASRAVLDIPNAIPATFMNGEAGWFLTGIATFNGRTVALLENPSTNSGEYLGVGETLRQATLSSISRNSIVLIGSNGQSKQFTLLENRPIVDEANYNATNAPFDPLVGAIGINKAADNISANDNRIGTE